MGGGGGPTKIQLDENGFNPVGTTFIGTLSSIVKTFWGAGALALPLLFLQGGIAAASGFLWVLGSVALFAIFSLTEMADMIVISEQRRNMVTRIKRLKNPAAARAKLFEIYPGVNDHHMLPEDMAVNVPTFAEVGCAALGYWGGFIIDCCLAICQTGFCIAYVIFISQKFHETIGGNRMMWIALLLLPFSGLIMIPDLSKLSFVGVIGNLVYMVTIGIVIYVGVGQCCVARDAVVWNEFDAYGMIFGTVSFALEGISLILPVKAGMRDHSQFKKVMGTGMFIVLSTYWAIGFGFYILFGEGTKSPILDSMPPSTAATIAKLALSASIMLSFPFQFFPITDFFLKKLSFFYKVDPDSLIHSYDFIGSQHFPHDSVVDADKTDGTSPPTTTSRPSPFLDNYDHDHPVIEGDDEDYSEFTNEQSSVDPVSVSTDNGGVSQVSQSAPLSPPGAIESHHSSMSSSAVIIPVLSRDEQDEIETVHTDRQDLGPVTPPPHLTAASISAAQSRVYVLSLVCRFAVLGFIAGVSMVFPDFKLIISLFGSCANSSLAYIFPNIFWMASIAFGTRRIRNDPTFSLETTIKRFPTTFFPTVVFNYERTGKPICIEEVLAANQHILQDYRNYPERYDIPNLPLGPFFRRHQEKMANQGGLTDYSQAYAEHHDNDDDDNDYDDTIHPTFSQRNLYEDEKDDTVLSKISSSVSTPSQHRNKIALTTGTTPQLQKQSSSTAVVASIPFVSNNSYGSLTNDDIEASIDISDCCSINSTSSKLSSHFPQSLSRSSSRRRTNSSQSLTSKFNQPGTVLSEQLRDLLIKQDFRPLSKFAFGLQWLAFPSTIVLVGIVASCIGVVDSMKEIIEKFGH